MSDIRLDEAGTPWQSCPRCGLDVIPSANGWRTHDPFCNGALQPYMTLLANRGLRPFEREPHDFGPGVLGEMLPLRWRVASDQWYRLESWVRDQRSRPQPGTEDLPATLFGWPIDVDRTMAPGSITLVAVTTFGDYIRSTEVPVKP